MEDKKPEQNYIKINANPTRTYFGTRDFPPSRGQNKTGYFELEITAVDNLFIGSGFVGMNNNEPIRETMKYGENAIIPGSSLKGCIRNIARIVSDGCTFNTCNKWKDKCIICDIFGSFAKRSKVTFSDMVCENSSFVPQKVNSQINNNKDSKPFIYRVYKNKCTVTERINMEWINAVKSGCVFKGKVFFSYLTETELNLLCFALGLGGDINLKIGGYKPEGLGQIHIEGKLFVNGEEKNPTEYAKAYESQSDFQSNIQILKSALAPYGGGKV